MKELRRIVRNGNSTQVSIPRRMLEYLGWRPGEPIVIELTECGSIEIRRPVISDLRSPAKGMNLDNILPGARP